ncbi:uncharacterized protein E0L32_005868 [Thyridium curvatum]|uniref:Uncharacterized protein n=1 Tax=Thyridium curvatum TaxID=1093900 RepID=A0A507AS95_9PEZI|nr:uncharacterized protein E0L32_005868 [Thyridium curvatum]TPX13665.1 hypothetical protein E0L32_005868 [Thyridium curvatum]
MKLTPTPLSLSLCLHALDREIKPHLPADSLEAQSGLKTISTVLSDLLSRYAPERGHRPFLLNQLNTAAKLEADIRAVLESSGHVQLNGIQPTSMLPANATFEDLSRRYEETSGRLARLSQKLAACSSPEAPALLRKAAEWEAAYHTKISGISQDALTSYYDSEEAKSKASSSIKQTTLEAAAVEAFLRESRSDPSLRVPKLARLAGGHGKQTYMCDVVSQGSGGEETTTLVIRKEDPAPIILRSTFRVNEEFALLRDLSNNTDFPCPRPFDLANPAPEGVDAPFFTMTKMQGAIGSMYLGSQDTQIDETMARQLASLLARLHTYPIEKFSSYFEARGENVDAVKVSTISDRYKSSLDSWSGYFESVDHLPSPFVTWLLSWLKEHIPKDERTPILSHGDFSIHNLLQVDGNVSGVLDWECAEFLSPEQELAYLQPLLSKSYSWDKFLEHYHEAGGPEIREDHYPFVQAYAVLRTMLAFNRALRNLMVGDSRDVRFLMVEYGYFGAFMGIGLEYTSRHPSYAAIQAAAASIDKLEDDANPAHPQSVVKKDAHGPQANALAVRGDEANIRQPHGSTPNWQNSVVLVWWDEEHRIGGFHRLGHEPNRPNGGEAIIWTNLLTPEGMFKRVQSNPLRKEDTPDDGSFGSGDDTCTVKYANGEHIWTINEPTENITARIVHRDTGPNVDCFPKHGSMDKDFATAHFDIAGRVTGSLSAKGRTYNIQGLSIRDHAWGTRDWGSSAYGHRWLVGTAGANFSFMAVSWHASANDRVGNFGWVVRDGEITLAKIVDIIIFMEVDSCTNRGGRVRMELTTGEVLDIECEATAPKASVCWHLGMACVDRICSFKCKQNGVSGFANVESTSNIQMGDRKPGTLVAGIIENGFTFFK